MNMTEKGKRLKLRMKYSEIDTGDGVIGHIYVELPNGEIKDITLEESERIAVREGTY